MYNLESRVVTHAAGRRFVAHRLWAPFLAPPQAEAAAADSGGGSSGSDAAASVMVRSGTQSR